jgi:hypothetical protein
VKWYCQIPHPVATDPDRKPIVVKMGGLGPMLGQAQHFYRYAFEKVPYAMDRYMKEGRV